MTVSITRETHPANLDAALEWVNEGLEMARHFNGSLGGGMLRDTDDTNVVQAVYRFRDKESLERWEQSEARQRWLANGDALIIGAHTQRRTGIEGWFDGSELRQTLDTKTGLVNTVGVRSAPVRWKQSVAIWLGMFPLNLLFAFALAEMAWLQSIPQPFRSALIVTATVPIMTYAMMPMITRVLRPWLRRNPGMIRSERALNEALKRQAPRG